MLDYLLETKSTSDNLSTIATNWLSEFKTALRVSGTDEDALISSYIIAAVSFAEDYTKASIANHSYTALFYDVPYNVTELRVPRAPVRAISSVKRIFTDGTDETLTSSQYTVYGSEKPIVKVAQFFSASGTTLNGFQVAYTAGYENVSDIPELIKIACMRIVDTLYQRRGDGEELEVNTIPYDAKTLLNKFRVKHYL